MREILFRGKRKDNNEWEYGFFIGRYNPFCEQDTIIYGGIDNGTPLFNPVAVDIKTVGQYTGLKDKNGTKIFEGDIVRWTFICDYECYLESLECPEEYEGCDYSNIFNTAVIYWGGNYDYPAFDLNDHNFDCNGLSELLNGDWYFEIIGNIHDNPELLKGETE